jgi:hypothetical protein
MTIRSETLAKRRAIALNDLGPEEAAELLVALQRSQPTPAAVALDHLVSGDEASLTED